MLVRIPDLPRILVDLGYEPDTSWVELWQQETGTAPPAVRAFHS
jgi:hypothetical protein